MRSALEKETIILYNQSEKEATVFTFDPKLIRKLERLAEKYPEEIYLKSEHEEGAYTYIVPKECVLIREPYSKERREAARQRALQNRAMPPVRGKKTK